MAAVALAPPEYPGVGTVSAAEAAGLNKPLRLCPAFGFSSTKTLFIWGNKRGCGGLDLSRFSVWRAGSLRSEMVGFALSDHLPEAECCAVCAAAFAEQNTLVLRGSHFMKMQLHTKEDLEGGGGGGKRRC